MIKILRDIGGVPPACRGAVIALGNFDGVHKGHQAVLSATVQEARRHNAPPAAMTFVPHPRRFFAPNLPPLALTTFRCKAQLIAGQGIEILYALRFNRQLAETTAGDFLQRILTEKLGAAHVVTGENFVFGKGREGHADMLREAGKKLGFGVTALAPVCDAHGIIYGSTRVRTCLQAGDMEGAAVLLGRPYAITGHVRPGDRRGRAIGFPTANLLLRRLYLPAFGVYAIRAAVMGPRAPQWIAGVANVGVRPTFGKDEPLLEAHLFDFEGNLYGRRLQVQLLSHLREERRFPSITALAAQIAEDSRRARKLLSELPESAGEGSK